MYRGQSRGICALADYMLLKEPDSLQAYRPEPCKIMIYLDRDIGGEQAVTVEVLGSGDEFMEILKG